MALKAPKVNADIFPSELSSFAYIRKKGVFDKWCVACS